MEDTQVMTQAIMHAAVEATAAVQAMTEAVSPTEGSNGTAMVPGINFQSKCTILETASLQLEGHK